MSDGEISYIVKAKKNKTKQKTVCKPLTDASARDFEKKKFNLKKNKT